MSGRRRLLLYSSGHRGPGTLCGGVRIVGEALRQITDLCVLAVTDTPGTAVLTPTNRFDHVLLPPPALEGHTEGLRSAIFESVLSTFRPDVVVAMRPRGSDVDLLRVLTEERDRRPDLRTALALWDVPGESESEALATDAERLDAVFDETWSFGDPSVHDHRPYLPPALAANVTDLGYVTYDDTATTIEASDRGRPRISVSLGTGWLAIDAVGALRAALDRRELRALSRELVPNAVLGQKGSARLAEILGIGLRCSASPPAHPGGREVVVSTGGYNSVCAALSSDATPVLVHDTRDSSAGLRSQALSELGVCSNLDLGSSQPADIERTILDALDRSPPAHRPRSGGAMKATNRILGFLRRPTLAPHRVVAS